MISCRRRAVLLTLLYWALWTGSAGARTLSETLNLKRSLPQLYHTPEVFLLNYKEMSENLKVYIYPNSQNTTYEYDVTRGGTGAPKGAGSEIRFLNALLTRKEEDSFVTNAPEEVHLFFLPVSIDVMVSKLGPRGVGTHLRDYVQLVRDSFPFWDRALGADHFYLASKAYEILNERNNVEFSKNAIQVACSPLPPQQFFFPHKDIALPSYSDDVAPSTTSPLRSRQLAHVGLDSIPAPSKWKTDADFGATSVNEARFFVTDSMRGVVDALRVGCVPVLVLETLLYDLPFQDILNWRSFALVTGAAEMAHLKKVLTSVAAGEYERMQYLGVQASKHMQWNEPPAAYDAFHMTLFQLWMRRHSVKYARRSDS